MNEQNRAKAILAIHDVCMALLESVQEAGSEGAPAGILYAAVMGALTLEQFERLMGILVQAKRITKSGHVYYAVQA